MTALTILAWCLTTLLLLAGLIGTVVPLLPGTTLILAATVLHKLMLPATISWGAVGGIAALWLLSLLVDFACVLVGTRLGGGTKWGMAGAGGGAIVGAFVSVPALVLGSVLGAMLAEKIIHRRNLGDALRAGLGAGFGFFLGILGRLACAAAMIILFLVAVLRA
ncbi:MAG TPA: DUF456 domain-containing protein [Opitutaceae bacterium]|nr:DUF456 domain-containing protein [Opitutaceae bacterium]